MIATAPPVPPTKETLRKRRVWSPSPRERAMYCAVAVEGRAQRDVGAEFGRSQSAVSRLVKRFERWRGGTKGEESGELDSKRQARLDRWLERERAEEVYRRSMRLALKMEQAPATTSRRGDRDGKAWSEETKRDQLAAAGQMLKTALRASEQLGKLSEKPRRRCRRRTRRSMSCGCFAIWRGSATRRSRPAACPRAATFITRFTPGSRPWSAAIR